jgi:hypothetical protein
VRAQYTGAPPARPPRLCCPACGRPLEFLHYLGTLTLVPAGEAGAAMPAADAAARAPP